MYGPTLPVETGSDELMPSHAAGTLQQHNGAVLAVRFNRQGTYCLTCGKDRTARLWNPHKALLLKTYTGHGYDVRDACVAADNSKFVTCGGDRQIYLWDVSTGKTIRRFRGHDGAVNAVEYAADDEVVVSAGYDQFVKVWDCRSRSIDALQAMKSFKDSVSSVTTTQHGDIVAGGVDGTVQRFDLRMGLVYCDDVHAAVTCVAVTADGNCVLAACLDSMVRLLDNGTGKLLARYTGHQHTSSKLDARFTIDNKYAVCGSEDGRVVAWDVLHERVVREWRAHTGVVTSLSMHPDGNYMLTASSDGTAKLWATSAAVEEHAD